MQTKKIVTICLSDFIAESTKVLAGTENGHAIRKASKIDSIEACSETIFVAIPEAVCAINPSFFDGFFHNIVNKLGRDGFLDKVKVTHNGEYDFSKPLNEAISRILRARNFRLVEANTEKNMATHKRSLSLEEAKRRVYRAASLLTW